MQGTVDPELERLKREIYESRITVGTTLTQPHRDAAKNATEAAVKFAESSLKSASLLNGGGLVAITPVMTLVGASATSDGRTILAIAGGYFLGLVAGLVGQIAGFQAMSRRAEAADHTRAMTECFLAIESAPSEEARGKYRAGQAEHAAAGDQRIALYNWWIRTGLIALTVAVAAFVVASSAGAIWFWHKLGPDSVAAAAGGWGPFPSHWLGGPSTAARGVP